MRGADFMQATQFAKRSLESFVPAEHPLQALTLQGLYRIRRERMNVEQLGYNLLFRWFVGVSIQNDPCDHSTFS